MLIRVFVRVLKVASKGQAKYAHKILVRKPEGKNTTWEIQASMGGTGAGKK
jgi:hypothetical protein